MSTHVENGVLPEILAGTAAKVDRRNAIRPQLHALLHRAIVNVDLPPGVAISKNDLARIFGVSRTPVQEVLLKLETEGLVEIFPQAGTFVSRMKVQEIEEALFLRETIEPALVERLATNITSQGLEQLEGIVSAQREAFARGGYDRLWDLDGEFHRTLCELAGMSGIWRVLLSARGHLARVRNLSVERLDGARTAIDEHAEILKRIAAKNPPAAAEAMRSHTQLNLQLMRALKDRFPGYFEGRR